MLSLSLSTLDKIYSNLEDSVSGRQAFGLTCRRFHKIATENEKFIALATFVQANYLVHATNVEGPLWIKLKNSKVYLIGETHTEDGHRKLFAEFTHTIWEEGKFTLLTEDKFTPGTQQIKYLKKEIADSAQSWDLVHCKPNFRGNEVFLTKEFLLIRDTEDVADFIIKSCLLMYQTIQLGNLSTDAADQLIRWFQIMSKPLENCQNGEFNLDNEKKTLTIRYESGKKLNLEEESLFKYHRLVFLRELNKQIYNIIYLNQFKDSTSIRENLPSRDQNMVELILNKLRGGQKVIIYAGSTHVTEGPQTPVSFLRHSCTATPFISLIPKPVQRQALLTREIPSGIKLRDKYKKALNTHRGDYFGIIESMGCFPFQVLITEDEDIAREILELEGKWLQCTKTIVSLMDHHLDAIYHYIEPDREARAAFRLTSKRFNNLAVENNRSIKLAKYIEKKYSFNLGLSPKNPSPLWQQLKKIGLFLVDENHLSFARRASNLYDREKFIVLAIGKKGGNSQPEEAWNLDFHRSSPDAIQLSLNRSGYALIFDNALGINRVAKQEFKGGLFMALHLSSVFLKLRDENVLIKWVDLATSLIAQKGRVRVGLTPLLQEMKRVLSAGGRSFKVSRTITQIRLSFERMLCEEIISLTRKNALSLNDFQFNNITSMMKTRENCIKNLFAKTEKNSNTLNLEAYLQKARIPFVKLSPKEPLEIQPMSDELGAREKLKSFHLPKEASLEELFNFYENLSESPVFVLIKEGEACLNEIEDYKKK